MREPTVLTPTTWGSGVSVTVPRRLGNQRKQLGPVANPPLWPLLGFGVTEGD